MTRSHVRSPIGVAVAVIAASAGLVGTTGYLNALVSPWVTNTNPPPALNWNRIDDFGYLAQHLTAVESKVVIDDYYGARAHYSFWNGCSTGGRQGLMEAQRYPSDFNGILAGAPALNWDQFMVAQMWPQLVMEWNQDVLTTCKENLVNTTLQAKCHDQDGQVDGVFDPRDCNVLGVLRSLIGTSTPCGTSRRPTRSWSRRSGRGRATPAGAYVPTLGPGGGLGLATTYQQANGQWAGAPFIRYFLAPGVAHCGTPGAGSVAPTNPMQQVINWVEQGQAPAVLNASGTINGQAVTRPLCPTPTRTRSTPAATRTWPRATPAAAGRSTPTRSCSTASAADRGEVGEPRVRSG